MNKWVLVTGAEGGIGSQIVQEFKKKGWNVIGTDIKPVSKDTLCDLAYQIDISNKEYICFLKNELTKNQIRLNCVINNAAIQIEKQLIETTEEEWDRVLNVNLKSVFLITKFLFGFFDEQTSIVNVSSVHARATSIGLASYVASKGGLSALTRAMALKLAQHGIRVNTILPGAIETEMLMKGLSRNNSQEESMNKLIESSPLKKIGLPQDVAKLAYFLSDNETSGNITGHDFVCDSGVLARLPSE